MASSGDAAEVRSYLTASGIPQLLEDFVVACGTERPTDVVTFMAAWAQQRGAKIVTDAGAPAAAAAPPAAPPPPPIVYNMGRCGNDALAGFGDEFARRFAGRQAVSVLVLGRPPRADAIEAIAETAVENWSPALREHVRFARACARAHATGTRIDVAAAEGERHTCVLVNADDDDGDTADSDAGSLLGLCALASCCDAVAVCVSCADTEAQVVSRDGPVFNHLVMAHASGIRRGLFLVTDAAAATPEHAAKIVASCEQAAKRAGFDPALLPVLKAPTRAAFVSVLASLPTGASVRRPKYLLEASQRFEATVVMLRGSLTVGETVSLFATSAAMCRVEGVPSVIDRATGKILAKGAAMLKGSEVGVVSFSSPTPMQIGVKIPLQIFASGKPLLIAVGSVTFVNSGSAETSATSSDFAVSDN